MSPQEIHHILNRLPDAVLNHLALFLPQSSRALLGAALSTNDKCNWTNDEWDTLDFSDLDKDLAAKLTDDDLYHVLKWIDATWRLRILKLTGCVNVIGHGLRILNGAINLRQIDLSLVGRRESTAVVPKPALAQAVVLPILSQMVNSKHVDIKHIQMPKHWRIIDNNSGLKQFFALYSKSLAKECVDCSECNEHICRGGEGTDWMMENGLQKFTCYQCMDSFCNQCNADICGTCEKLLCGKCGPVVTCSSCSETACDDCKSMDVCGTCEKLFCFECDPVMTCYRCNEMTCNDCKPIGICDVCKNVFCDDCNPTSWCDFCERMKCVQCCRGVHHCVECNTVLCDNCVPMCCCHSCSRITCSQCGPLLYCQGHGGDCDNSACEDCSNQTQNVW